MKALLTKFRHGLQRTKTALVRNLQGLFNDSKEWDEDSYEELEAALIGADLGVGVSMQLVDDIRDRYKRGEIQTAADIIASAKADVSELLKSEHEPMAFAPSGPTVILMVGVNGSGKTTTSGKLAAMWKAEGKEVMLAACDTFRAAACEQLKIWGTRVNCPVISSHHGADPASVAFDACTAARARGTDVLIIDTAGRQHTASNLMRELGKIHRSCEKACPGAPQHTWLVVDGSTGTNALAQARAFTQYAALNGLCLTKLDGSSKGGVVVAIHAELHYPIRFLGLGEEVEDLQPFDADMFADSMFSMD
ncbi:MAG: fused signal recognition particle receptor [Rhodothermales bacterium]|jgi:fused signal recognition particle receptor